MREKILAGRYVLVEQIGVGGMAIVYRAIDRNTGHSVAVKVLKPEFNRDAEFVSRFQREAEAASKMTHHNIVNLLDVGMDGENRYLIMEYVKGQTLKDVIQQHGRIRHTTAAQITIRILSALQHAHQNGIIHRDIKPQNILVHADGHIKVADFGIARMANSSTLTRGDSVMGSVHYFSPEQAQGQGTDVTSDLYSVGVTLYEMLTGRVPFDGDSPVAIAMQHLHAQPEPIRRYAPEVPEAICHVCLKAMEKNPQYRYHSAREMASELRMALEGRVREMQPRLVQTVYQPQLSMPSAAPSVSTRVRQTTGKSRTRQRNTKLWLMTAIVALVVGFGLLKGVTAIIDMFTNVTVGDYLDYDVDSAVREIRKSGLQADVKEVYHETLPSGIVFMQQPSEGATLDKGDKVVLTVSKGPEAQTLQVPELRGRRLEDAKEILRAYKLTLSVVEYEVSRTQDVDFIIKQVPEQGTICKPGDEIQVTVSGGVAYVPRLQGTTCLEARELIAASGLTLSGIEYVDTEDVTLHDRVMHQSIAADTAVIQRTSILLTVYRVPAMLHRAQVVLELPVSEGLTSVRVTLVDQAGELTAYQNDFPSNASRHPKVDLVSSNVGEFTYKVYVNNVFKYADKVRFE